MNAKEFLLTDPKIEEAVSNGYDIRLEEHEWIEKMELYALTKQNSHKHGVSGKQAISELITFCEEQKRKQYAIAEAAGYTGNAHHIGAAQAYHKVIVKLNELAGVCSGLDKNA